MSRCTPGIGTHKIYRHAEAWQDARNICKEDGGDLAVINSEAEAQVLVELMAKSHPHFDSDDLNYVLIGFDDIHHNGKYVTVDGKSLKEAGYEKWARGEPNNGKGSIEDCGSMFKDGRLNDMPCWKKCGFVCELNISLEGMYLVNSRRFHTKIKKWPQNIDLYGLSFDSKIC